MDLLILLVYSFFVWLIFIKFKWLPWNITSQVIVVTLPIIGLAVMILMLNIGAPSSADVRAINFSVQIVPRVTGRVTEVPVEPNRPVKKGDVLFRIDPVPFRLKVDAARANIQQLRAKLIGSRTNQRTYEEQLKEITSKKAIVSAKLDLARLRVKQYGDLASTGAGTRFDLEQAQSELAQLTDDLASLAASEAQARLKTQSRTKEGDQDEVARTKAEIAAAEAQLGDAQWELEQTTVYAPNDGVVVNLQLRAGQVAAALPMAPVMTFVENEQWVVAVFGQNEGRKGQPGQEAEIALRMYPGRIIKCKVDSVVWATAGGVVPVVGPGPNIGGLPPGALAVRLFPDDKDLFIAAGARGFGAIYTDYATMIHILRKVFMRVSAKLDWLILKLH